MHWCSNHLNTHTTVDDDISISLSLHTTFYNIFKDTKLDEISDQFRSLKSQGRVTRESCDIDFKLSMLFMQNKKLKDAIKTFVIWYSFSSDL